MFCIFSATVFYQSTYVLPFVSGVFALLNTILIFQVLALLFLTRFAFYSLFHVTLTYCLIFFGFIPPLELIAGAVYWSGGSTVFNQYPNAMVLCIVGIGAFALAYFAFFGGQVRQVAQVRKVSVGVLVTISALSAAAIYAYNGFSVGSVMTRGGVYVQRVLLGQTAWLIYQYFLYPLPTICLVTYLLIGKRRPLLTLALFTLFLAANPITGMARFQAAALYIAVLLALMPRMWSQRGLMIGLLFLGTFLILPILDKFRNFTDDTTLSYSISFIYDGHFDGFQMFALSLEEGGITWGRQLIGALLFFVPRAIWADKPVSSGTFLANASDLGFDNISFTFFAEGYINFGIFGVVIFAIALGWFTAKYDTRFQQQGTSCRGLIYYHFAGGLLFFLMRGSLMNGVAFALGAYCAVFAVVYISSKK